MNALRRPGLRFVVEAVLIVLTAVITGLFHLGAIGIGGAVAIVWLIYVVIEYSLAHPRAPKPPEPVVESLPEPVPARPAGESVRVITRRPEPEAVAVEREPEPELEPEPEPEPVAVEPEPEPVAVEPEPEPEPVPDTVPVTEAHEPRQWNVWELESALRERGEATEEHEFLLIYLRDYAGPDGQLPVDFDQLVRESFPDLLGTPTA